MEGGSVNTMLPLSVLTMLCMHGQLYRELIETVRNTDHRLAMLTRTSGHLHTDNCFSSSCRNSLKCSCVLLFLLSGVIRTPSVDVVDAVLTAGLNAR